MASGVTLPRFTEREKLLYQKLNALSEAVEAKFLAGVSTADLAWPLVAAGNLDMSIYNIIGGRQIWGYVNAAEYDTLEDAAFAAGSGGVVLVPPETTIVSTGAVTLEGSGAAIIGAGPSSVIQLAGGSSAVDLLNCGSGSGVLFANLVLDGNAETGTGSPIGLNLTNVSNVFLHALMFRDFKGSLLKISSGCSNVMMTDCSFDGGAVEQVYITDCTRLAIANMQCVDAGTFALRMESAGAALIEANISNFHSHNAGTGGIKMLGANIPGGVSGASFRGSNIRVTGAGSGNAIELGSPTLALKDVSLIGGEASSAGAKGLSVAAGRGSVGDFTVFKATTTGIDLETSQYVTVHDCTVDGDTTTALGVDGSDCSAMCTMHSTNIRGVTDAIADGPEFHHYNNDGVVGVPGPMGESMAMVTASRPFQPYPWVGDNIVSVIPADTLLPGDVITVKFILHFGLSVGGGVDPGDGYYVALNGVELTRTNVGSISATDEFGVNDLELIVIDDTTARVLRGSTSSEITGLDFTSDQDLAGGNNIDGVSATGNVTIVWWDYRVERRNEWAVPTP